MTEYCENGDLQMQIRHIKKNGKKIEENTILRWCRQVTDALKYLHQQQIIHRDVKPNNIFLTEKNVAKLGDLGMASVISEDALPMTRAGTEGYMSPEVCNEEPYDTSTDMWSLGCCLYELAALRQGHPYTQVRNKGYEGKKRWKEI
ncbi:Serine/threonine-protein kinase Nek1 [Chionoecetes opilio]|uniref:non-specific serine/threonine protein kinase n=1 Tax=Chionoecetes opilio TaxID=41210 RepID=A0A8J5CEK2_CHIOP|nr:Serine/threonine-protein kinase Nek1 [Chionoecetes opilio]